MIWKEFQGILMKILKLADLIEKRSQNGMILNIDSLTLFMELNLFGVSVSHLGNSIHHGNP
ncbi:hypothetical protein RYX36_036558 [Vicia faba]